MQHLSEVAHILGAALVGDTKTVRDYAALLTSKLTADGEGRQAHTLRTILRDVPQPLYASLTPRRDELADWLSAEHAFDDMNSRCECGWYYGSPETFEEHLANAFLGWLEEQR